MTALAFVDTETTGLDPRRHHAWEIAVIRRPASYSAAGIAEYDREFVWQIPVPLDTAAPEALDICRYKDRFVVPDGTAAAQINPDGTIFQRLLLPEFLYDVQEALQSAVVVGSNPGFDLAFLANLLQPRGRRLPWHYRPVDVATLAAGYLHGRRLCDLQELTSPWSSREVSRAVGVEPPGPDAAHTALGDARWVRDLYDAVTTRATS